MNNKLKISCPRCQGQSVKKNGIKGYGKQNWLCKSCGRQFIGDHQISCPGCDSRADQTIQLMLARCCGIRDIAAITGYSKDKVQGALKRFNRDLHPGKPHYDRLEVDEFWTFVGNKKGKVWLLYAYERASGEMVAYVWGKRDVRTVRKLGGVLKSMLNPHAPSPACGGGLGGNKLHFMEIQEMLRISPLVPSFSAPQL